MGTAIAVMFIALFRFGFGGLSYYSPLEVAEFVLVIIIAMALIVAVGVGAYAAIVKLRVKE